MIGRYGHVCRHESLVKRAMKEDFKDKRPKGRPEDGAIKLEKTQKFLSQQLRSTQKTEGNGEDL